MSKMLKTPNFRYHSGNFSILQQLNIAQIIFSNEAHFDLGGYVNKHGIWGTENPYAYVERPTHPKRVTVWCGFWIRGINRSFFFENEHGR